MLRASLAVATCVVLAACPPPSRGTTTGRGGGGGGGGGGANGGAAIDPDACGTINTSEAGRKLYAFLVASSELDRASSQLEGMVYDACRRMAVDLGTSTDGDTKELCTRAANELQANLQVSTRTEKRLVTRYTPPVCHTSVDLTASFVAECEASAAAQADVRCEGRCNGTCNGTCSTGGAGGRCDGTCDGRCSGECEGYADVHASAECEAAAEVHASTHTECTEPKVEVVQQDVTVVDATKFAKAMAAINDGLPQLLRVGRRLELAAKALERWGTEGAQLASSAGDLVTQIGEKGLCVGGQLASIVAGVATIQARFTVSIEVTAQVSASAGATAQ